MTTNCSNVIERIQGRASKVERDVKHRRRFCKTPGCTRIVKSQGLCQRHGAVAKKCKVEGCTKQAQGNFRGMCKSHFKTFDPTKANICPPTVEEVPENVLSASHIIVSVYESILPSSVGWTKSHDNDVMPLCQYLKEGFEAGRSSAWHRNDERRVRGLRSVQDPSTELEQWERDLAMTEILVLSGSTSDAFAHFARAWGKDGGFHVVLSQFLGKTHKPTSRYMRSKPKHHLVSNIDIDWAADEEKLTAGILDFSGEFFFENLEEEIDSLDSCDESANENDNVVSKPCSIETDGAGDK